MEAPAGDAPNPPRPAGRRDASMLLLTTLVEDSLDQGYARAAARRPAGQATPGRGRWVLAAGLVAVGLLLATAAAQTRERASAAAETRAALVTEIGDREQANDRVERSLERQRAAVARERRDALRITDEGLTLARRLGVLEATAGAGAVRGPGMLVRLSDAAVADGGDGDTDPRTRADTEGRVTDRDLQTVVNEVWAAGAEAVAVNRQRLTALSAIRSAGEAVLVDFRPLNPPYEIRAIGPPDMATAFAEGFGGSYLQVLRDYGIEHAITEEGSMRLPASSGVSVRYATSPADVPSRQRSTGSSDDKSTDQPTDKTTYQPRTEEGT